MANVAATCPERQGQAPPRMKAVLRARSTCQWPAASVVTSHCTRPDPGGNTGKLLPSKLARACTVAESAGPRYASIGVSTNTGIVLVVFS